MNKNELIEKVANLTTISRTAADSALNALLTGITDGLRRNGEVKLSGFGSFKITTRKARVGFNPQTRLPIQIAAKRVVRFSAGTKLKATINSK